MKDIEQLQKEEIKNLNEEIELEQLILNGKDARIPIEIQYPIYKEKTIEYIPVVAMIRPLTNIEANQAQQKGMHNKNTTPNIEIVKKGLYTKNLKPFQEELVEQMPSGVVDAICMQILEISGIQVNTEENVELVRKIMGF